MPDEKPRIDLPDPFGLGGVEFQTPDELLTPQKMGALEQHLERAGWLNLQEGQVLLDTINAREERIKALEQSRQDLVKAAFATAQERDQLRRELAEERETWADEYGTTWTRPTAWAYAAVCKTLELHKRELVELQAAINPDGSLTEHQQFVETAQDGAHALDKLAEIEDLERQLAGLKTWTAPDGTMLDLTDDDVVLHLYSAGCELAEARKAMALQLHLLERARRWGQIVSDPTKLVPSNDLLCTIRKASAAHWEAEKYAARLAQKPEGE